MAYTVKVSSVMAILLLESLNPTSFWVLETGYPSNPDLMAKTWGIPRELCLQSLGEGWRSWVQLSVEDDGNIVAVLASRQ